MPVKTLPCDVRSKHTRSVLADNLAMDGCLVGFDGVCRGLDSSSFREINLFYGAGCMGFLSLQMLDQAVLVFGVVDGVKFLECTYYTRI